MYVSPLLLCVCVCVCVCQLLQSLSGSGMGTASAGGRGGGGEAGEEEPLYVNAKQYQRILKRRQQRARLEQEGRIPKHRMVCVCVLWFRPTSCRACTRRPLACIS